MARGPRSRRSSQAQARPPSQEAAIRHVRWLIGRVHALGRLPGRLRRLDLGARRRRRGRTGRAGRTKDPREGSPAVLEAGAGGLGRAAERVNAGLGRLDLGHRSRGFFRTLRRALHRLLWQARALGGLLHALLVGLVVTHRRPAIGLLQRALWWSALVLFAIGSRDLLRPHEVTLSAALPPFIVGFALCALALLIADSRRIRVAAALLGFGHGALGVVLWAVLYG